jgi:hypothetical protein
MSLAIPQPACAECHDAFIMHSGDCCGRCHRVVCRACSSQRGRFHESVLCASCNGTPKPTGFRATTLYRMWKRVLAG